MNMNKGTVGFLSLFGGVVGGVVGTANVAKKMIRKKQQMSDKHLKLFLMMNQWVKIKQEGKSLTTFFDRNGYKQIAIYGMSYAGETLVEELKGSNITIKYGIDKRAANVYAEFDIVLPGDNLEEVDAIIVTSITFYDEIETILARKIDCPIISLEDVLYEV